MNRYEAIRKSNQIFIFKKGKRFSLLLSDMINYQEKNPHKNIGLEMTGNDIEPNQLRAVQKHIKNLVIIPKLY